MCPGSPGTAPAAVEAETGGDLAECCEVVAAADPTLAVCAADRRT
jgi:hypothetical protein